MSGYKLPVWIAVATGGIAIVLLIIWAVAGSGDTSKFGRVPIPGQGTVELEEGDVLVYYEEQVQIGENDSLDVPEFEYSIRPQGGGAPLQAVGEGIYSEEIGGGGTTRTTIGKLEVAESGTYAVEAGRPSFNRNDPELTFGEGMIMRLLEDAKWVLYLLGGGFAVAAILALATFVRRRLSPDDERVTMPPTGSQ